MNNSPYANPYGTQDYSNKPAIGLGMAAANNARNEGRRTAQQWSSMNQRPTPAQMEASVGPNSRLQGAARLQSMAPVQGEYKPTEIDKSYLDKNEVVRDMTPRYSQLTKKKIFGGYNPNAAPGEAAYTFSDRYAGATRMGLNEDIAKHGQTVDGSNLGRGQLPNTEAATNLIVSGSAAGRQNAPLRAFDDYLQAAKEKYSTYNPDVRFHSDGSGLRSVSFNSPPPSPVDFYRRAMSPFAAQEAPTTASTTAPDPELPRINPKLTVQDLLSQWNR